MPRVKKNPDLKSEKQAGKKNKTLAKKPAVKIIPKKKVLPVVVDVIEDKEPEEFFPELPVIKEEPIIIEEKHISEEKSIAPLEIDQQKKFYSDLVTEIKEKNPELEEGVMLREKNKQEFSSARVSDNENKEQQPKVRKSVSLYRRLVWRFVIFTICLLLVVFYFSFSKLTIVISPKGEPINDNLLLKVQATSTAGEKIENDFREQVTGTVKEIVATDEKTFSASGEEFVGEEVYGQVKIINNSAKDQALVATTRILSPENKLFRIKDAVNVPAGGEASVEIYADKPSEEMAISATSFTIPGLWLGLQDKIYAKSSADFVYRQKVKRYIKESDIERGMKEINDSLIAKAKLTQEAGDKNSEILYENLNPFTFETSARAGDAKENFTIRATGSVLVISFSKEEAAKLTLAKLDLLIPDDRELVDYSPDSINYTFDNYDSKNGLAIIKASFNGTMALKNNTEIIDKKQLVNLNRQQLENYLKTFPEIKSYEFKFFPSFITRAPRLPERIQIEVKGLEIK